MGNSCEGLSQQANAARSIQTVSGGVKELLPCNEAVRREREGILAKNTPDLRKNLVFSGQPTTGDTKNWFERAADAVVPDWMVPSSRLNLITEAKAGAGAAAKTSDHFVSGSISPEAIEARDVLYVKQLAGDFLGKVLKVQISQANLNTLAVTVVKFWREPKVIKPDELTLDKLTNSVALKAASSLPLNVNFDNEQIFGICDVAWSELMEDKNKRDFEENKRDLRNKTAKL